MILVNKNCQDGKLAQPPIPFQGQQAEMGNGQDDAEHYHIFFHLFHVFQTRGFYFRPQGFPSFSQVFSQVVRVFTRLTRFSTAFAGFPPISSPFFQVMPTTPW